ncbi:hypothetical protein F4781DRAFT_430276 [Annulohypoxylon bovei var. microspora]|nr:hypothetical protein F4781DRAFT_430276 [Annulohypoxylon bovei var. microspora]
MPHHTSPSPSLSPTSRTRTSYSSPRGSRSSDSEPPPRQRRPLPIHSESGREILKTSLVFLGVMGAASIAVSKYWPKGILYGEKESWAQEAKEEVKHVMKGDRSNNKDRRRRSHNAGHVDQDAFKPRRPPHVNMRDEAAATRPGDRNMYLDTGSPRQSDDDGSSQSRRRIIDPRDRRRFSDEPLRPREFKGLPYIGR